MTDKQKRTIKFIENMLEIQYTGTTDKEVSEFIGNNLKNAQKCSFFESHMSMTVFSAKMSVNEEPALDLKRELSRELLIRDIQKGKSNSEAMTNFSENLIRENNE